MLRLRWASPAAEAAAERRGRSGDLRPGGEGDFPQPEPESGETGGAARETDGGSPWLDTNLKNNITEGMETSPKDDFHLYVNYEWLLDNEIPDGYSTSDAFLDVEQTTTEKTRALLEDDSLESHEAKLVQDFYHAWLDWDGRNAAGMEPLTSRLEDVESIDTLQELSEFVCDRERSYYVPTFVSMGNSVDLGDATRYSPRLGGTDLSSGTRRSMRTAQIWENGTATPTAIWQ